MLLYIILLFMFLNKQHISNLLLVLIISFADYYSFRGLVVLSGLFKKKLKEL